MEIIAIEGSTFNLVEERLDNFFRKVETLCADIKQKDKWLDNQDVCEILQISKRTLQYYRDSGKLSFSQIGGKCYYKASDMSKLVQKSVITKK